MTPSKHISSVQNVRVKEVVALKEKSRERLKTGLFVVEGQRELQLAVAAGYSIKTLFYCGALMPVPDDLRLLWGAQRPEVISVTPQVYGKMAHRSGTEGILAVMHAKAHGLRHLGDLGRNPLILVAEAPEKPGNIGALLRTADAANLDAVIIANPKTDLYNPNVVRSSVGCVFSRKIATASSPEIIAFLQEKRVGIFCAALSAAVPYLEIDFRGPSAIVVGTEHDGLTPEWLLASTKNTIIPMEGKIDSMNVSVSAAILIFEAKRQRKNR
ncbi:TrmH family RNA methyltransferase [Maribacter sp. 2307ULW6-5]|uniref:TrmH family RNA methyltransferase n=1 Tax=Maribacter sp. 2307ULW6-5 TaxID=3386275 RepID=UPI0039BD060B